MYSCVRHDSLIWVTWLLHVYVMIDSCDMNLCMCVITASRVRHQSWLCGMWLIDTCAVTHWYAACVMLIREMWLIDTCDVTHWYVSYVWCDSLICVMWLICGTRLMKRLRCVPWIVEVLTMEGIDMWLTCATQLIIWLESWLTCVPWIIQMLTVQRCFDLVYSLQHALQHTLQHILQHTATKTSTHTYVLTVKEWVNLMYALQHTLQHILQHNAIHYTTHCNIFAGSTHTLLTIKE